VGSRLARVRAEFLVAACVAFLVACQALAPIVFGPDFFDLHSNFGYVRILPEFVLGIALYRLGTERRLPALESSWAVTLLAGAMLILSLLQWDLLLVLVMGVLILAAAEIIQFIEALSDELRAAGDPANGFEPPTRPWTAPRFASCRRCNAN